LSAYCVRHHAIPRQVRADPRRLGDLQKQLIDSGIDQEWPADIATQVR
jgi:hypothetical protein